MGLLAVAVAALLAGCGQKGPLYMPDDATQIVTRPTQTPPETPAPVKPPETPAPATPPAPQGDAPNSPQTIDTPQGPGNPAPEVTAPVPDDAAGKDKKQPGAPTPR